MEEAERIPQEILNEICPGLYVYQEFITPEEENRIIKQLDEECQWDTRLSRRVQHFGFEFDYASRKAFSEYALVPFPSETKGCLEKVKKIEPAAEYMNQLTVNEYLPGQGISAHIDTHSCLGDVIISMSLLGDTVMRFIPASCKLYLKTRRFNLWLPRRSLLIMKKESRLAFKHAIPLRMTDLLDGNIVKRSRRVSLTFRSIRIPPICECQYSDACDSQNLILEPTRIPIREPLAILSNDTTNITMAENINKLDDEI